MVYQETYKIPSLSINLVPNSNDMKIFASNYTKEQWKSLTYNREFLNVFTENLDIAKKVANKILFPEEENKNNEDKKDNGPDKEKVSK